MGSREQAYELYKQKLKYKDIAQQVGVSLNTVKSWAVRYWKKENELQPKAKKVATQKKEVATKKKESVPSNSQNKRKKGGQPNNKNAVKHGGYTKIFWDTLSEEEHSMIEELQSDEEFLIIEEIKLLTVRERRIMQAVNKYKNDTKQLSVSKISTVKSEKRNETQTFVEANSNIIMRLESELTNVQSKKTKAIETLNRLRANKDSSDDDLLNDWINAVMGDNDGEK